MRPDRRTCRCRCRVWPRLPPRTLRSRARASARRAGPLIECKFGGKRKGSQQMLGHSCRTILSGARRSLRAEALAQLPLQHLACTVLGQTVDDPPVLRALESGDPIEAKGFEAAQIERMSLDC